MPVMSSKYKTCIKQCYKKPKSPGNIQFNPAPLQEKIDTIKDSIRSGDLTRAEFKKEMETLLSNAKNIQIVGVDTATVLRNVRNIIDHMVAWSGFSIVQNAGFILENSAQYTKAMEDINACNTHYTLPPGATIPQFHNMFREMLDLIDNKHQEILQRINDATTVEELDNINHDSSSVIIEAINEKRTQLDSSIVTDGDLM
jgi:hypothetical protein